MNKPPGKAAAPPDTVSYYISEFQRRFVYFERARREELRHMKHDFAARLFSDHIVLGDKTTYDCMLQAMLKEDERDRLETDPRFTKAWRIFVDLCWMKKRLARAAMILGGIILILATVALVFLSLPYVAGPGAK
jgi:hypothetical protein